MAINVTDENFKNEVIEKSKDTPVMVDFWAEWCGPCRMLGPVLEKIENNFGGRFILAKLDTDHNQKTAGLYKISGIPAVKLFVNGVIVDEFTGAMSEPNVLKFLEKHIADPALKEAMAIAQKNVILAAEKVIQENLQGQLAQEILWNGIREILKQNGDKKKIKTLIDGIPAFGSKFSDGRNSVLAFIDSNPSNEDFAKISLVISDINAREGLEYFLKKVENSTKENKDQAKENLLASFYLIGTSEQIVNEYRKKLASVLY